MIGVDIVEVDRIRKIYEDKGDDFLSKVFSADEIEYARKSPPHMYERLAARYAAKEAVAKAFGTGFNHEITWRDIEVAKGDKDEPLVKLSPKAQQYCASKGIKKIHLSLSHTEVQAIAHVMLEK